MDDRTTRRRFLGAAGTGAAALTLPTRAAASTNGAVVFVYDDGPIQDYTQAFPVHREFDAPASTGIVTGWIGRENFMGNDWMTVEQIRELADAGWEVMSHTTEHTPLGTFTLVEDVGPNDDRLYADGDRHGLFPGKVLEITDGTDAVRRTVGGRGRDDAGRYVELAEPVGTRFAAGETVFRYPDALMHEFLGGSRRELEALGFEVDTILCPYDNCDEWTVEFVRRYYDGIANANHGSYVNERNGFDPYGTRRNYFVEFATRDAVRTALDHVAEADALGVLGAHTFKEEVSPGRIRETLEWVDERDLEVITLREAIRRFGSGRFDSFWPFDPLFDRVGPLSSLDRYA